MSDRPVLSLAALVVLLGVTYSVYVMLALEPSDLQVATRYTAFGGTNFYRSKWYYLTSFGAFGLLVTLMHLALAIKLYSAERRHMAVFLMLLTILLIVIAWIVTNSVFRIAFL